MKIANNFSQNYERGFYYYFFFTKTSDWKRLEISLKMISFFLNLDLFNKNKKTNKKKILNII